jgi:outer membrane receptor protein involved in Fe transport
VFTNTNVNLAARDPETGEFLIRQTTFPNPLEVVERWESPQTVNRFVGSFQARATPANLPSIEYRFGYDTYGMETDLYIPRGTPVSLTGSSTAVTRNQFLVNNDIVANYTFGPASLQLTSTVGMNHTYSREETVNASALDLTPTTELVRGAVQSATQNRFETATLGAFAQQQIGFNNQFFLTGALRWDASSTFGVDERWQLYPKVSGSYVLSASDWWQESMGSLFSEFRLRGALGYAGNQPPVGSAYARIPRYTGVTNINRIGLVHLGAAGNPNLKPERQREYEIGFDAGLFQDRIGLAFTYYNQYITDLLLTRPFPPSSGYASVLDNVGELSNHGIEVQINTRNVDEQNFGWNTTLNFSRNRNKVEKLAGSPFTEGYNNYVAEGYALGVWKLFDVKRDANGNVITDEVGPVRTDSTVVMGDPNPDFQASLRNEFRLGRNLTANVLLDGVFGHDVWNQTVRIMDIFSAGPLYDQLLKGEITQAYRARIQGITGEYLEDASFVKLREISLSYLLPASFVDRLGFNTLSLEIAARNLYTFTDYSGYDPETNMFGTSTVARGTDFATYPNPRTFSFGVRAGF